jgi:hypothetical protein
VAAPTGGGATTDPALDEDDAIPFDEGPAADADPGPPPVAPRPRRAERPAAATSEPPEPAGATGGDGGDVEGARLIALNMALNGQSRDETDRYLAENFDLADRQSLLDEVYESVGG